MFVCLFAIPTDRTLHFTTMLLKVIFYCLLSTSFAQTYNAVANNLFEKLNTEYNPQIPPSSDGNVTVVTVNMYIRSIERVDVNDMEYTTQITLRQMWSDERLAFDNPQGKVRYITLNDPSKIWVPDLMFVNEKEAHFHNIVTPNAFLRIFPSGTVLYSTRITLKLSCPMNLQNFPMDEQVCTMKIVSYSWTTDDLVILWKKEAAVQVVKNLQLQKFTLTGYDSNYCSSKTLSVEYSCIYVEFLLKRQFAPYFLQIYVPCSILVLVSWLPIWFEREAFLARIFMATSTFLVSVLLTNNINNSLPTISYVKAIDVFTTGCLISTLASLIAVVLMQRSRNSSQQCENVNLIDDNAENIESPPKNRFVRISKLLFKDASSASKILLPAAFTVFVCVCCGTFYDQSEENSYFTKY